MPADRAPLIRAALVLSADHEFNASTFAARVVASTGANLHGSTIAGLAAINGPRHGGLTRRVAALFDELKADRRSRGGARQAAGRRLRPAGLRPSALSRRRRPRRDAVRDAARDRCPTRRNSPSPREVAEAGERLTGRQPNVDFATVTIERVLGLPQDSALAMFLLGRTVGWIAHALEQAAHGGLIRPRARYTGPRPTA